MVARPTVGRLDGLQDTSSVLLLGTAARWLGLGACCCWPGLAWPACLPAASLLILHQRARQHARLCGHIFLEHYHYRYMSIRTDLGNRAKPRYMCRANLTRQCIGELMIISKRQQVMEPALSTYRVDRQRRLGRLDKHSPAPGPRHLDRERLR